MTDAKEGFKIPLQLQFWHRIFRKESDDMRKEKSGARFIHELAGKMYIYFISYDDRGAPSFGKFAKSVGITRAEIEKFREKKRFDKAYRECCEIRRDYLIDRALDKRFDPSFVKFLLSSDYEENAADSSDLTLRLEISE